MSLYFMNTQSTGHQTDLIPRRMQAVAQQLFVAIIFLLTLLTASAHADSKTGSFQIQKVRVGFNGYYKIGRWTEIRFDFFTQ